jgi:hypothetical protein
MWEASIQVHVCYCQKNLLFYKMQACLGLHVISHIMQVIGLKARCSTPGRNKRLLQLSSGALGPTQQPHAFNGYRLPSWGQAAGA